MHKKCNYALIGWVCPILNTLCMNDALLDIFMAAKPDFSLIELVCLIPLGAESRKSLKMPSGLLVDVKDLFAVI